MNRVQKGQPLRGNITAEGWNAAMAAAEDLAGRKSSLGGDFMQTFRQAGIVLVKNAGDYDRGRFDVLGIDGVAITASANLEEFQNRIVLSGDTPAAADHTGRFVVLLEPIAAGAIGKAVVSGVCPVQVDVQKEEDEWADVSDDDATALKSGSFGGAAILWKESGTGKRWAVVRVSNLRRDVAVKLTGNAEGGGKYSGKLLTDRLEAAASGDLAMPEAMVEGVDCLFLNMEEDGLPTHWLAAGGADGYAYVEGIVVGHTEETPPKPIVMGHGGKARLAYPATIGSDAEGSETAETTAWRRREKSTGYVSGDCPIEVYIMTRPPVYSESGDKKFYCFLRKALVAADGRWDAIGPEVRSEIFDTCEHT
ncbi:MAG: hypothetical protein BWX88_05113 [Planctomycetes bacterium ADurb.Bin126]|nr:MAG: hypothetical protein BWX88_05113 [Planctomycetes bacterium ADurb.Bin126]HOD83731.1 hypothetical protein [Phycisphaerae bacterium]